MTKKPMNSLFLDHLLASESNIETNVEKWIKDFDLTDTDKINEISEATNAHIVYIMACWGEIGWCLPKWIERKIEVGKVFANLKNNVSITEIDKEIADYFTERDIEAIMILTQKNLSDTEKRKLDLAFDLYLKQEYFASATLLAGLIDSVSINHALNSNSNTQNVSQCWKCYGKVIQENFGGTYFSAEFPSNKSAKDDKRGEATIEFFKSIKHDVCFDNKKNILIPLSFALLKFFDDSDWQDKQNGNIPSSINRHWLAHNMYDYDDITRADCIKLFCMLYQIAELYSML